MFGPVMMAIRSLESFRKTSFGMKRAASCPASRSMTGWRPARMRISPLGKRWPLIAVLRGRLGERRGNVQLGNRGGGGADSLRLRGGPLPHLREQLFFEGQDFLFGVQHLALVILELGRGEALGVGQRLLALVVGGGEVEIGPRDFDVVAEDVVEPHLERLDAGALALARLNLRDHLAAVAREIAQFVELGAVAGADGAAVGEIERRLIGDGIQDEAGYIGELSQAVVERAQAAGLPGVEAALQRGNLFERTAEREHIARDRKSVV